MQKRLSEMNEQELYNHYEKTMTVHAQILSSQSSKSSIDLGMNFVPMPKRFELEQTIARIIKKHNSGATDFIELVEIPPIMAPCEARVEAMKQIEHETWIRIEEIKSNTSERIRRLEESIDRVERDYVASVAKINNNAGKRGILASSIVIDLLERADAKRADSVDSIKSQIYAISHACDLRIARINQGNSGRVDAVAKRMINESSRNHLAAVREQGLQKSRGFRDMVQIQRTRQSGLTQTAIQLIDEEVYGVLLEYLTSLPPARALRVMQWDSIFLIYLSMPVFIRLNTLVERRHSLAPSGLREYLGG